MTKKKAKPKQDADNKPSYVGIPSIKGSSNSGNTWWKIRDNILQQIASSGDYSSPFKRK